MIDTNCQKCNLQYHRRNFVKGIGQIQFPKLFIIDEAPDSQSDMEGRASSGGMGRVLYRLIKDAGFSYDEVYITSVVKCRPPNGRDPEMGELIECRDLLIEELRMTQATHVVCIGEIPSILMTGKKLIEFHHKRPVHNRGYVQDFGAYKIVSTYSPSILVKNPELWSVAIHDIQKLFKEYPKIEEHYLYNPPADILFPLLESWRDEAVAVDIETSGPSDEEEGGLDPKKDIIVGVALVGELGKAVQLSQPYLGHVWSGLKDYLETHQKLVYHNNSFDRLFFKYKGIESNCFWDTMNGGHLQDSRLPKTLDFMRSIHTNEPPYKTAESYANNLAWLNCKDVDITLASYYEQEKELRKTPKLMPFYINSDTLTIDMRHRGVKLDVNRLGAYYHELKPKVDELALKFEDTYGVSISSPKQLTKFLFQDLGFTPPREARKGKSGGLSTDEKVIDVLLKKCIGESKEKQALLDILEYRGMAKTVSTYCEGLYSMIDEESILHPPWSSTKTDTGRWGCKKPNLLNVPEWMRDMFIPREGNEFYGGDFTSAQIWGAALVSGDQQLLEVLLDPKRKIHREVEASINAEYPLTATMIERYGEEIGKAQSYLAAKSVVFGTFFGRTPQDIAHTFHVPVDVAITWQEAFFLRFPIMGAMFINLEEQWKRDGYTEGIWGQRKYSAKVTEAKNFPIQNFEPIVVTTAMGKLREKGFHPVIYVYDQVVCEEPIGADRFEEFMHILRTSSPDIYPDLPVVGKAGMNWKEVK